MNQSYRKVSGTGERISDKIDAVLPWRGMELPEAIPQGDMPGDKIEIGPEHRKKGYQSIRREQGRGKKGQKGKEG